MGYSVASMKAAKINDAEIDSSLLQESPAPVSTYTAGTIVARFDHMMRRKTDPENYKVVCKGWYTM